MLQGNIIDAVPLGVKLKSFVFGKKENFNQGGSD
jgi:hypothetical protein